MKVSNVMEASVDLRITSDKYGEGTGPEYWNDYPLEAASQTVRQWVEDGVRDRVEIRNDAGELLFHYPRNLRPAHQPE